VEIGTVGRRPWWQDAERPLEDEAVVWTTTWFEVALRVAFLALLGVAWYAFSRWWLAALAVWLIPASEDEERSLRARVARRLGVEGTRRFPARRRRLVVVVEGLVLAPAVLGGGSLILVAGGWPAHVVGGVLVGVACAIAVAENVVTTLAGVDAPPDDPASAMRHLRLHRRADQA
jgi:hypothetical protein